MTLHLARGLDLPVDAVSETFAFLAKRGAGKTYAAGVLAEEMLDAGAQIIVLDPVGKWWGLRLDAKGKSKAHTLPIFGGKHGDIPLSPSSGVLCAQMVVERGWSVIFDLILFDTDADKRRFVATFCRELFRLKSQESDPAPLHLFLEEAEEFVPQAFESADTRMIGAVKKCVKLGRNFGIGVSLISQRSADVNKKVLSQTEYLVALRTKSPHDLKAIKAWLEHMASADVSAVMKALPDLEIGQAYVIGDRDWKLVKIRKKRTLDTSATPKVKGRKRKLRMPQLSEATIAKLRAAMEETVQEIEANDPKRLRLRIKELEKRLKTAKPSAPEIVEEPVVVLDDGDFESLIAHTGAIAATLADADLNLSQLKREIEKAYATHRERTYKRLSKSKPATKPRTARVSPSRASNGASNGAVKIKKGARRMLAALAARTEPTSKLQLGTLIGMKHTGGTFNDYLGTLRRSGFVIVDRKGIQITADGEAFIGDEALAVPTTTEEVLALWRPKFKQGARKILDLLVENFPNALTKPEIGNAVGNAYTGGTFNDYLGTLVRNGMAVKVDGAYVASEDLFL